MSATTNSGIYFCFIQENSQNMFKFKGFFLNSKNKSEELLVNKGVFLKKLGSDKASDGTALKLRISRNQQLISAKPLDEKSTEYNQLVQKFSEINIVPLIA